MSSSDTHAPTARQCAGKSRVMQEGKIASTLFCMPRLWQQASLMLLVSNAILCGCDGSALRPGAMSMSTLGSDTDLLRVNCNYWDPDKVDYSLHRSLDFRGGSEEAVDADADADEDEDEDEHEDEHEDEDEHEHEHEDEHEDEQNEQNEDEEQEKEDEEIEETDTGYETEESGTGDSSELFTDTASEEDADADTSTSLDYSTGVATKLRLQGKEAHDNGDFLLAAKVFQEAADSLREDVEAVNSEEYATCRLHQALCYLKSEDYEACLEACTTVLDNSITPHTPAVRARAHHRRAKAKLALDDPSGALQDARSAAFLGDRKAVALYGKLMRESSSSMDVSAIPSLDGLLSSSSSNSPTAGLFESLLSKSADSSTNEETTDFNPASLLFGGNSGGSNLLSSLGSGGNTAGLAKSLMQSAVKRLDETSTQSSISKFLQNTDKGQLQQYASMAGMEIPDRALDRIESICHGVTPKAIKRTVSTTKGAIYGIRILRRISKLIQKYKSIFVALAVLQWAKSAVLRPMPVDRAAAKQATKAALKEAMKTNREAAKVA